MLWESNYRCFEDFAKNAIRQDWLHYPYTIQTLKLDKLFRKPIYCVMGRIDMFAVLRTLLPRNIDSPDLKWI